MAFPQTPLPALIELHLGGSWVDITGDTFKRGGLTIERGRPDEGSRVDHSRCRLELNNRLGHYSPRNPMSSHYGQLGRNTPLRVSVRPVTDAFGRTVVDGWGPADTGQAWSTLSVGGTIAASDYQVTGGVGKHFVPAAGAFRVTYLAAVSYADVEVTHTLDTFISNVAGASIQPGGIILRGQSTTSFYLARVNVATDEVVTVGIYYYDGSSATLLGSSATVDGLTFDGSPLTVRASAEGHTLRMKVWLASGTEPADWQATVNDDTLTEPGFVGIYNGLSSGNTNTKPVEFRSDDFQIRLPRFTGEVSSWPQRWDVSGSDVWVPLEASGIMRRLTQGATVLQSAPRRWIPTTDPIAYWPLEDGPLAMVGAPVAGEHPFRLTAGNTVPDWGQGDLAPWLAPVMRSVVHDETGLLDNTLKGTVDGAAFIDQWTLDYMFAGDGGHTMEVIPESGALDSWALSFGPDPDEVVLLPPFPALSTSTGVGPFDGTPHHVRLTVTQDGADADYVVYLDGVQKLVGTISSHTMSAPNVIHFRPIAVDGNAEVLGHVALWYDAPSLTDALAAAAGYNGELAGRRMERLCAENDVDFSHIGDLDLTEPMGPQRVDILLSLLEEAADADAGILHEPRDTLGLAYRTRSSMYTQDAALALDYEGPGHVAPPLEPTEDDALLRNDVTVKRSRGSAARATVDVGPLSTLPPPDGVGRYAEEVELNVLNDDQATHHAGWRAHLGTWDEARYPVLHVNLLTLPVSLHGDAAAVDLGDRITIDNPPAWLPPDQIDLLVQGATEQLLPVGWDMWFNASPGGPWQIGALDDDTLGRLDTAGSEIYADISSSATSYDVTTTSGPVWTVDDAEFPLDIGVGGERITVTDIPPSLITYVGVGTAAHADDDPVTPGLPAGWAEGDLLLIWAAIRNSGTGEPFGEPTGYERLHEASNAVLFGKIASASESDPSVNWIGGVLGASCSAQMAAFRGKFSDVSNLVVGETTQLNSSAQNIAYPALSIAAAGSDEPNIVAHSLILYLGWKADDCTSVATIGGATEIGEPDTTLGDDQLIVWDYLIQTTATAIAAGSFTVTGGVSAISRGSVVALRADRQTFTVTRSVNGIQKSHSAGAEVKLWTPLIIGM